MRERKAPILAEPGEIKLASDRLAKGDVLDTAWCERFLGVPQNDPKFLPLLNRLGQTVQFERKDLVVSTVGYCLRILTDDEAEQALLARARKNVREQLGLAATHGRIVRANLSDSNKKVNDAMTAFHASRALEANAAHRKLLEAQRLHLAVSPISSEPDD